jgi:hypothetical protein
VEGKKPAEGKGEKKEVIVRWWRVGMEESGEMVKCKRSFLTGWRAKSAEAASENTGDEGVAVRKADMGVSGLKLVANSREVSGYGARLNIMGHVNNKTGKGEGGGIIVKMMNVTEGEVGLKVRVVSTARGGVKRWANSNGQSFVKLRECPCQLMGLMGWVGDV